MTATDQGPIVRQAIRERLEHETEDDIAFDCGFGYLPDDDGTWKVGYAVVFKVTSPRPGRPVLVHEARMFGHTPTDDQVDEMVTVSLAVLREKAAQALTPP